MVVSSLSSPALLVSPFAESHSCIHVVRALSRLFSLLHLENHGLLFFLSRP